MYNILNDNRFEAKPWFSLDGLLVHEIQNKHNRFSLEVETFEYLIEQFHPILHKIQILNERNVDITDEFENF